MFGLMLKSTHDALIAERDDAAKSLREKLWATEGEAMSVKARLNTSELRAKVAEQKVADLEAQIAVLTEPVRKAPSLSRSKSLTVKVPVKGKVEAKSGKVTK